MYLEIVSLFFAGMLAGEEFVVRYGVRGPLAALDDRAHIAFRQGLIRTLRILVPSIFVVTFGSGIAVAIVDGTRTGIVARWCGVLALVGWILVTLFGTVPINERALAWSADAPPADWRDEVDGWERLNTVRTWMAVLAFALFLVGVM